jgi:hypothetical protein
MQVTHDSRSAISRARFFLGLARALPADARVEFEAFLEAAIVFARAAVHRMKTSHGKHPKWKRWWDSLSGNPAIEFFRVERDWILKEAPPKIGQKVFASFIGPEGTEAEGYKPARADEFYYFEDPGTPATATLARHLDVLSTLLSDAEREFK